MSGHERETGGRALFRRRRISRLIENYCIYYIKKKKKKSYKLFLKKLYRTFFHVAFCLVLSFVISCLAFSIIFTIRKSFNATIIEIKTIQNGSK